MVCPSAAEPIGMRAICLLVLVSLLLPVLAGAYPYGEDPSDPDTVAAARQAVANLDESRGALALIAAPGSSLAGEVVGIVGLASTLSADVTPLEQAIENLGAAVSNLLIEVTLSSDVLFDFDSDSLKPAAESSLLDLKTLIESVEVLGVTIIGHTDAKGSDEYNLELSRRRAESVHAWLTRSGINQGLCSTEGHGENEAIAPNTLPDGSDNPEGRALNRRVEILISTRQQVRSPDGA